MTCEELSELCTVADVSGRLTRHSRDSVEFDAQFGIGPGVESAPCVAECTANPVRLSCAEAPPVLEEGDLPFLCPPRRVGPDRRHRIQVIATIQTDANLGSPEVMRTRTGVSSSWERGGDGKQHRSDHSRDGTLQERTNSHERHAWSTGYRPQRELSPLCDHPTGRVPSRPRRSTARTTTSTANRAS